VGDKKQFSELIKVIVAKERTEMYIGLLADEKLK